MEDETDETAAALWERIAASFEQQGLMRHLGAHLRQVKPGRVNVALPNRAEVAQQHGYVHAGAISAIADSAGGYAASTLFPQNTSVLTVEYKINLLAPAVGDHIEAVGTVLKSGRTLTVCRLEAFAIHGSEQTLVATGRQTLICVAGRPEHGLLPPPGIAREDEPVQPPASPTT